MTATFAEPSKLQQLAGKGVGQHLEAILKEASLQSLLGLPSRPLLVPMGKATLLMMILQSWALWVFFHFFNNKK